MGKEVSMIKSGPEPGFYKIPGKEVFGYSTIDFAMNLVFASIMMFITIYYTDVYGLKPFDISVMFMASRIWDAINDPMMGALAERRNPKRGKYKPYIYWGAIPFAICGILCYTVPDFGYVGKLVWAYLTYNMLNMMYTFIINPYISVATVMTADPKERTKLQSVRMCFAQSGGVVVALTIPTLSTYFGNLTGSAAKGYQMTVIILSIVTAGLLLFGYSMMKERIISHSHEDPVTLKEVMNQISHNKPGVIMFFLFFGVYAFNTISSTAGTYYMTYNAGRTDLVALFSLMNVLPSVFGVPMVPAFTRMFRKKGTVIIGLSLCAIGSGLLYIAPVTNILLLLVFKAIASFGYGILMGILWAIITDPVEYGDLNTGKRYPAIVMTTITLGLKFSMTVGGVIPTMILDAVDYVPNAQQTAEALAGIKFMTTWLPCIVMVITIIIFGLFYDLNEEKLSEIQHKIAVRDGLVAE